MARGLFSLMIHYQITEHGHDAVRELKRVVEDWDKDFMTLVDSNGARPHAGICLDTVGLQNEHYEITSTCTGRDSEE